MIANRSCGKRRFEGTSHPGYSQPMNYATVVPELFSRFPKLEAAYRAEFAYMGDEEPGQYIVFGSILIPALTAALENGDLGTILPICAFLEDASTAARHDGALEALLKVEVAEWLGWVANEERLCSMARYRDKTHLQLCSRACDATTPATV
jgi:hypothetical protein